MLEPDNIIYLSKAQIIQEYDFLLFKSRNIDNNRYDRNDNVEEAIITLNDKKYKKDINDNETIEVNMRPDKIKTKNDPKDKSTDKSRDRSKDKSKDKRKGPNESGEDDPNISFSDKKTSYVQQIKGNGNNGNSNANDSTQKYNKKEFLCYLNEFEKIELTAIGLDNPSVYCFMNSCMQCLISIPEFNYFFAKKEYRKESMAKSSPVTCDAIYEFIQAYNSCSERSMMAVKQLYSICHSFLARNEQHDCQVIYSVYTFIGIFKKTHRENTGRAEF